MQIKADTQGKAAIEQLCDIALKSYGVQAIKGVQEILDNIEIIEESE